ncbi:unnamed protein product [Musa acuminata subsp. burmannicoides]
MWATGTIPCATPVLIPRTLAPGITDPAAVDAVWVPCPCASRWDTYSSMDTGAGFSGWLMLWPSEDNRAPISFRLQLEELSPTPPGKRLSTALAPAASCRHGSLAASCRHTPVSSTPMMVPLPNLDLDQAPLVAKLNPKKV